MLNMFFIFMSKVFTAALLKYVTEFRRSGSTLLE